MQNPEFSQVPVTVTHGRFEKPNYLYLVVHQMLYELKVVLDIVREHAAQGLNYAMLQDIRRVKFINFRESKVQGKLLRNAIPESNRLPPEQRRSGWRV